MTEQSLATHPHRGRWGEEARATLILGWPLILTNLGQTAISTTDVVLMGWLGAPALAAGALGANMFFAFFVFGLGIAASCSPLLAQERGRKRHSVRDVRRTVRQGMWATTLFTLAAWAVLWHTEAILLAIGQQPDLARDAGLYMDAMQWCLLPALWFLVLRSFVAALERPKAALVVTLLAILLNAACCWVLMFGKFGAPKLGLIGAGISSTIANSFMFFALLAYIYWDRRFRRYHLLGRFWRADWPRLRELVRIGLPISVTMGFEVTVFNVAVFLMGLINTESLAAHSIAIQIASVTFMVPMGLAQAATVRVGLSAGRKDAAGVARAGWVAVVMGGSFMFASALLLIAYPLSLIGVFLDMRLPENGRVIELAVTFLAIAGLFQVADGLQSIGAGVLRGLKDTKVPMIFAGVGYWLIGLPFGAALAFKGGLGGLGIWIGLALGLGVVATLMLWRWMRRERLGLVEAPAP